MRGGARSARAVLVPLVLLGALGGGPGSIAATPAALCTYDGGERRVDVNVPERDVTVAVEGEAIKARVEEGPLEPCGDATVTNTDSINVGGDGFFEAIWLDQTTGSFEPGATPEGDGAAEIEIHVEFGTDNAIVLVGTSEAEEIRSGAQGIDADGDGDVDITYASPSIMQVGVDAGAGGDVVTGSGGGQTGGPTIVDFVAFGGTEDDVLTGGSPEDALGGGPGNDTLVGLEGRDVLVGDDGDDFLDGGRGADPSLSGGDGRDRIIGGGGVDDLDGGDARDRLNGGPKRDDLDGGRGKDRCIGGPGRDDVVFCP